MKKIITLGKIAYSGKNKSNLVEIKIELQTKSGICIDYNTMDNLKDAVIFSASGCIWDVKHYDYEACGQMLDEIGGYFHQNKQLQRIIEIWHEYHLNDMQAGTKKQTEAVNEYLAKGNKYDYSEICGYLNSIELYIDKGYKYGSNWLYKPIPENILNELNAMLN